MATTTRILAGSCIATLAIACWMSPIGVGEREPNPVSTEAPATFTLSANSASDNAGGTASEVVGKEIVYQDGYWATR